MFARALKEIEGQAAALADRNTVAENIRLLIKNGQFDEARDLLEKQARASEAPAIIAKIRDLLAQLDKIGVKDPQLPAQPDSPAPSSVKKDPRKVNKETSPLRPEIYRAREFAELTGLSTPQLRELTEILINLANLEQNRWRLLEVDQWGDANPQDLVIYHIIQGPFKPGLFERRYTALALRSFESWVRRALVPKGKKFGRIDKEAVTRRLAGMTS